MKIRLSNWKEESDLFEVVTGKMTDKEALKKVSEKKGIQNKVIINPKLSEAMEELGGEVVSVDEALAPSKQELAIMKKVNLLQLRLQKEKKKTTQKAEQAAKQQDDIAVQQEEVGVSSSAAMVKARKEAELKAKEEAAVKKQKESTKKEEFEAAVEYFYAEGINEEGIDLIIEEVGLDDFVDFVDDSAELLTEERKARKMNVRTLKATKKKAEEIKADKSDVVKRGTPSDTLARARAERSLKKRKLAKPAAKKEAPAPTKAKKTAAVVKSARKATVAKARKDFDGDGKVETPKQEHRGVRNKKITKAVAKAKPAQPKKPVSKDGLRAKIKSAYDAGVKRHRKATQPVRVFHKGMKAGAKKAVKFAKDVKKVVSEEELKERLGGKGTSRKAGAAKIHPTSGDWEDSDRGAGNKSARRAGKKVEKKSPTYLAHVHNKEEVELLEKKKKPSVHDDYYDPMEDPTFDPHEAEATRGQSGRGTSGKMNVRKRYPVKESGDRAFDNVVSKLRAQHGKDAVITKDSPKPKPSTDAEKKKAAAERNKRQEADNKAFADRAKKAGYKNPQDYANVVARYGSEDNYKKGRGLGT